MLLAAAQRHGFARFMLLLSRSPFRFCLAPLCTCLCIQPNRGSDPPGRWEKQPATSGGTSTPPSTSPMPSNIIAHELAGPSWGVSVAGSACGRPACNESAGVAVVPLAVGEYVRSPTVLGRGTFSTVYHGEPTSSHPLHPTSSTLRARRITLLR